MSTIGFKQQIIDALPGTLGEIAAKSGAKPGTVVRWLRIMRDNGECHVSRWVRADGAGGFKRVYVDGPGLDAPCRLQPGNDAKYSAKWRKNHPEATEIKAAKARAKYWDDRAKRTPQNWASALLGATC